MPGLRILSRSAAMTAMRLGREVHSGKRKLPPEIILKKKQIEAETLNAELFMVRVGAIDEGMVNRVVQLKLQLDVLYGNWAESEAPSIN